MTIIPFLHATNGIISNEISILEFTNKYFLAALRSKKSNTVIKETTQNCITVTLAFTLYKTSNICSNTKSAIVINGHHRSDSASIFINIRFVNKLKYTMNSMV